jgi:hypothetical protein
MSGVSGGEWSAVGLRGLTGLKDKATIKEMEANKFPAIEFAELVGTIFPASGSSSRNIK